jgi:hypothetical protein
MAQRLSRACRSDSMACSVGLLRGVIGRVAAGGAPLAFAA